MRTYIGPIGFNPTSITRPILSRGLDDGDAVTLVRPQDETLDRRAKETITDVNRTLGALEPDISTTTERIPHDDFGAAVLACRDIIHEAEGERILVLGGGARDVLVPLTIAGLVAVDCIEVVLAYSDIDGAVREVTLPNLVAPLSSSERETLSIIATEEDGLGLPDITSKSGHSKSTITRHVNALSSNGLVETRMAGKSKWACITTAGRLLLGSTTQS
jgi:CRISPR-associated protein Csa3